MNVRRTLGAAGFGLALLVLLAAPARAGDGPEAPPEDLYFKALHLEQEMGKENIEAACGIYERIVSICPDEPIAPSALLRFGICQRKLGRLDAAREAFTRLMDRFRDRPELRARAEMELGMLEGRGEGAPPPDPDRERAESLEAMRQAWQAMGLDPREIKRRLEIEERAAQRERERKQRLADLARELKERGLPPEEAEKMLADYDRVMREVNARLREQEMRLAAGPGPEQPGQPGFEPGPRPGRERPEGPEAAEREFREVVLREMEALRREVRELREEVIHLRNAALRPRPDEPRPKDEVR